MTRISRYSTLIGLLLPLAAVGQDAAPAAESVPAPAPQVSTEPELPAVVQVRGVETLADYATVGRLLGSASGVRRVDVTEAEGSTVTFRVTVRGGSDALARGLESVTQLARSSASAGRLVYELHR